MPRLLYVVNNPEFFLSHRLCLARGARDEGYDVHVATPGGPGADRIRAEGFPFHPFRLDRGGLRVGADLRAVRALVRLYRRLRPDVVHHVTIKPVLYGGVAARLAKVPAVVSAISGRGWVFAGTSLRARLLRPVAERLYRHALRHRNQRTIFQNPEDRAAFLERGLLRADQCALIRGAGVDLARYLAVPEPPGPPVVLLPARMLWDKGVADFVETARRLRAEGVDARFVLAGAPDPANPRAVPEPTLRAWHEDGAVEWWGRRDDMPRVFADSAVVCLPTYYPEGLPKALLEAAACARPIVTTNTPGCREIVRAGVNGLLVPPRSQRGLADALRRLLADRALRRRFGRAGRDLAAAEFSEAHVVAATLDVYATLTGASARAPALAAV